MARLVIDENSKGIQVLRPTSTEKVAVSDTAASSSALSEEVVRLVADTDVFYSVEGTATTSDVLLPAGSIEYIHVHGTDTVSVIASSGITGSLYITEMI